MFAEMSILKKAFHFCPILVVYFVIISVTYGYTKYYIFDEYGFHVIKFFSAISFYFSAMMVINCHLKSMFTSPGFIYQGWENDYSSIYDENEEKNRTLKILSPYDKKLFCQKCNMKRPGRSHHCKICNKCVLKMDHHCPWIMNCVGHGNQKFFLLFLFYATLGDFIGFIFLIQKCIDLDYNQLTKYTEKKDILSVILYPIILIGCTLLALSMTISIGFLFFVQLRFIMFNSTSIESKKFERYEDSPYYYENHLNNFKIVMGESYCEWFIPIFKKNAYNHGFYFINIKHQDKNLNYSSIKNSHTFEIKEDKVLQDSLNPNKSPNYDKSYVELNEQNSEISDNTIRVREKV